MGGSIDHEMLAPDSFFAMLKFKRSGRIGGYKQRSIKFVFTPTNIGDFEEEILLSFNNTESLKVLVKGECIDVPLYVESNVCDF